MATKARPKPIKLHFQSTEQVLVVPEDNDIFLTTASDAARVCRQAQDSLEWGKQWNDFLVYLNQWCKDHASQVDAGYVTIGDSALNVLVCVKAADYDFNIEDELAELDLALSIEYPMVRAEVMQIPNQHELRVGLSDESPIVVYGDASRTPKSGKT